MLSRLSLDFACLQVSIGNRGDDIAVNWHHVEKTRTEEHPKKDNIGDGADVEPFSTHRLALAGSENMVGVSALSNAQVIMLLIESLWPGASLMEWCRCQCRSLRQRLRRRDVAASTPCVQNRSPTLQNVVLVVHGRRAFVTGPAVRPWVTLSVPANPSTERHHGLLPV